MGTTPPITTNNPQNTRSTKPDQAIGPGRATHKRQAPTDRRPPRGLRGQAAVPVGGGGACGAWPRCRWAAAGPGRASRSTTPSRQARVWRSRGRAAAHRHIQRPGPTKQATRRPEICRGNKQRQTMNPPKCRPIQPKPSFLGAFHPMGLHFGRNNAPDRDLIATNRGICTTRASDTPVTRRQQASCSAKPPRPTDQRSLQRPQHLNTAQASPGAPPATTCAKLLSTRG